MPEQIKSYLGDGAYIMWDGYSFWLTTSNGIRDTNEICLEAELVGRLISFMARHSEQARTDIKATATVLGAPAGDGVRYAEIPF